MPLSGLVFYLVVAIRFLARLVHCSGRARSERIKAQMSEQDKLLQGLSRLLIDPDIEPMAKKSISRQMAEAEVKREELRQALEAVAVRAVANADDLLADCRQAFLEAKANFAGLLTPPQLSRKSSGRCWSYQTGVWCRRINAGQKTVKRLE